MEPITLTCLTHNKLNEIFCTECKTYICPECLSAHKSAVHKPKYMHIMQYSPAYVVPKIDSMLGSTTEKGKEPEEETVAVVTTLKELMPKLKDISESYNTAVKQIKDITRQFETFGKQRFKVSHVDNYRNGLKKDQKRVEELVKKGKPEELLRISQRIDEECALAQKQDTVESLVGQLKDALQKLEDISAYKEILSAAGMVATKCRALRFVQCNAEWKLDRKYMSSKMLFSEDNLTYGTTVSSGYPSIIADTDFESGYFGYVITPHSLDCGGSEGFGIIEKEKYLAAYNADKATPVAKNDIIGFMYKNEAKNMTIETMSEMQMDAKYYVKVSMPDLLMTIKGPGVSLKADLKPGVAYTPCFICGCTSNKLTIRPLSDFDEGETTSS